MMHFRKVSQISLAGFLMIWLSGVVFLFCCTAINAQAADAEFCPLSKSASHCDKSEPADDSTAFSGKSEKNASECCAFLPVVFDKARKIEKAQQAIIIAQRVVIERLYKTNYNLQRENSVNYRSIQFPRSDTFLKNCIFRI